VQKVLARHGRTHDGTGESEAVEPVGEQLALAALCGAAARQRHGAGYDTANPAPTCANGVSEAGSPFSREKR